MPKEEFLNVLHYVSGIIGSDSYNDKSVVQEERDEERLTAYVEELSTIYRENVSAADKKAIRHEIEKVFLQLSNDIVPHAQSFRKPANLFKVMASLGQLVALPQQAIDLVKSKPVELKNLNSLSAYISVVKGTSIKDNLKHYQNYLGKVSRLENLNEYKGLYSFFLAVNHSPDVDTIGKELSDILKKLEGSAHTLSFATLLQIAQTSARLNKGQVSQGVRSALDERAAEEVEYMDKNDFYQYFSLARYTGGVSQAVIQRFIERKSKDKNLELKIDWVKELITVYQGLPTRSESLDLLLAEFEADIAHIAFDMKHPLYKTGALERFSN